MTRDEVEFLAYTETSTGFKDKLLAHDASQRTLIEQQAQELTELRAWKQIILGTCTAQESVICMAEAESKKMAIQTWKEANEQQAQEIARLREALENIVEGEGLWTKSDMALEAMQALKEEHL